MTTDHISPAGEIRKDSPAGRYLMDRGIAERDFNTYGARRGMLRVNRPDGSEQLVPLRVRLDTRIEVEYYRHGGIVPYVLRQLFKSQAGHGR